MKRISIISILTILALVLCCACFGAAAEEAAPSPTPTLAPLETPGPDRLAGLQFVIEGPDERMPMTVSYGDFTDGKLKLEGLATGVYTVKEISPETLVTDYSFDAEKSVTTYTFIVTTGQETSAPLLNVYSTATPTATPTLTPTPAPTPEPPEFISIPVHKVWADNNNEDGNRPGSVTVYLNANGTPAASASLSADNGWSYTFTDLLRADIDGNEIEYTVSEQAVPMYRTSVNGYTITNTYERPTTSVSVRKVWDDNDNQAQIRPTSIHMRLSNGMVVVLSDANGWQAEVNDLPTIVNGESVQYSWTEQESLGYELVSETFDGTSTVFTNKLRERVTAQREDSPPQKGGNYLIIDEYSTPLGVAVTINHVGDCFE